MKKRILVLQFRTDKSLMNERTCILRAGNFAINEVNFLNMLNPRIHSLEKIDLNCYRGVILGGSGQVNISDWSPERKQMVLRCQPILSKILEKEIPTLGICFGHQLIAYILGGQVDADPDQAETGTCEIFLNNKGLGCPLFTGLPQSFFAVEGHHNSVTKLPQGATLLASSKKCKIEAYQIKDCIFGVQFHPELDEEGMKFRMNLFPSYAEGHNINEILKDYHQTPEAQKIIRNFKAFLQDRYLC